MGLWKPPAKVTLPSEFADAAAQAVWPAVFEYNGHLPDGTQVLAYVITLPADVADAAGRRDHLAAVHEFDADGHHRLVRTRLIRDTADGEPAADARLHELVAPYRAAGWRPGDIRVRPFLVELNGWPHGLVFQSDGDGLEGECGEEDDECEPGEVVWFRPFGFPFHPPYDSGSYDT